MARDVVVIFVHGIGVASQDYYQTLRDKIIRSLPSTTRAHVEFQSVFWAHAVRDRQQSFLQSSTTRPGFKPHGLHKFVIEGLGDAAAYQKTTTQLSSAYYIIQGEMRAKLKASAKSNTDERPVIFVGHSLGCHIASSYAWDLHKMKHEISNGDSSRWDEKTADWANDIRSASPLERLDTFAGFITMGSNQPLFTFQLTPQQIFPITSTNVPNAHPAFPGSALEPAVRETARWDNYFSSNDPLGYPLKSLNHSYLTAERIRDHRVSSEGWLRHTIMKGWFRQLASTPAHLGYWHNNTVARGAAKLINDIATAPVAIAAPTTPDPAPPTWTIFPHLNIAT
jgi:hypothetical protein